MAVYTKINQRDIDIINNEFNIEKILNFQGITKGIENTNYILNSKNESNIYLDMGWFWDSTHTFSFASQSQGRWHGRNSS